MLELCAVQDHTGHRAHCLQRLSPDFTALNGFLSSTMCVLPEAPSEWEFTSHAGREAGYFTANKLALCLARF